MLSATTIKIMPCRRKGARDVVARPSTVRAGDALPRDVTVQDLSATGFSFTTSTFIPVGTPIQIGLAGAGRASAQIAWRSGTCYGCRFHPVLTSGQITAAFSQSADDSITWLAPAFTHQDLKETNEGFSPAIRLAIVLGAGLVGWAMFGLGLRSLPF
ncbi:PilZ domain-containing protein [Sphingomonas sp. PB2P19]|uniref:PilZ domain-containing protein n=1 Tax=Sphingomonas rhamnosi TaxID=3096156 RepID=UPI003FA6EB1F